MNQDLVVSAVEGEIATEEAGGGAGVCRWWSWWLSTVDMVVVICGERNREGGCLRWSWWLSAVEASLLSDDVEGRSAVRPATWRGEYRPARRGGGGVEAGNAREGGGGWSWSAG
ncbi:hypothetical protein E3N88_03931 [Mikania micrantha]|uniref:Uncharacterized protein n=1 Tax=Mikania micrantha TaxID=192012 RepID=A0A5N6PTW1_9ASTR|nr:hypothetical protein E3N88_03931 [Mikania micrantha]